MKQIITLVAALAIVSNTAFAAPKKKTTTTTTTTTSSSPVYASSTRSGHDLLTSVDFGLGTVMEKFHVGVGFHIEMPYNIEGNHFRFGGQTGFYLGPSSPTTWVIPMLLTALYDIPVSQGTLKPYAGLGMGASLSHVEVLSISDTKAHFTFEVIPGIAFGQASEFYFQTPFGTMSGAFFILPSFGMHF